MNPRHPLLALLVSASLFGCTTSTEHGISMPLTATRHNAGQIGNTTLANWEQQTGFEFFISGVPTGTSLPLRIYTFIHKGSCQQPGPVAYAMNSQVTTERAAVAGWTFSRNAPIALPELQAGQYSIVVRSAPEDGNLDLFCGDIPQGGAVK